MSGVKHHYPRDFHQRSQRVSCEAFTPCVTCDCLDFLFTRRYWRYALVYMDWFKSLSEAAGVVINLKFCF